MNEELNAALEEYKQKSLKVEDLLKEKSELQEHTIDLLQQSCDKLKTMNNMLVEMNEYLKIKVADLEEQNKAYQDIINSQEKVITGHVKGIYDSMDKIVTFITTPKN